MKRIASSLATALITLALLVPEADAATKTRAAAKASPTKTNIAKQRVSKTHAGKVQVGKAKIGKGQNGRAHAAKTLKSIRAKAGRVSRTAIAAKRTVVARAPVIPAKPSFGEAAGLHSGRDALDLKSSVALVIDQETREVLFSKNELAVLPIASLTKLMTGMVLSEARLPMDDMVMISQADVDTEKGSRSRLKVGTELSRGELLHLSLMSSENRAAHALARTFPGGLPAFVKLMNTKAQTLGMRDTVYTDPTGLSSTNLSSARDLALLVNVAHGNALLRELSTSPGYQVAVGNRTLQFNNTNRLVKNPSWDIGLQKTGYISEAGQCLVMQTKVAGRKLIMVFLDSAGKLSRLGDAERVRRWIEAAPVPIVMPIVMPIAKPLAGTAVNLSAKPLG